MANSQFRQLLVVTLMAVSEPFLFACFCYSSGFQDFSGLALEAIRYGWSEDFLTDRVLCCFTAAAFAQVLRLHLPDTGALGRMPTGVTRLLDQLQAHARGQLFLVAALMLIAWASTHRIEALITALALFMATVVTSPSLVITD